MSVLSKAGLSASLEYWGRCDDIHEFPDFPKLRTPRNSTDPPLKALREMFAGDPKMQVTQEPDGTIRMVEADVPTDLLKVRISHISFEPHRIGDPVGSPVWGLGIILATPEVADFMRTHNLGRPFPWGVEAGMPSAEHVPGDLNDVTVSQALDYVLRTFPGLWIYENCPSENRKRSVFFMFYLDSPVWAAQVKQQQRP
jgi:hypothetical protein